MSGFVALIRRVLPVVVIGVLFAVAWFYCRDGEWFRLEAVHVTADNAATEAAAEAELGDAAGGSLLALDLADWRWRLESLPGVRKATLRRHLISRSLEVNIENYVPLARWHAGGVITASGERYDAPADTTLPLFKGRDGYYRDMAAFYLTAADLLGKDEIAQLELSMRGDWRLFFGDGTVLRLGREAPEQRLRAYARHAAALRAHFSACLLGVVDARYEKGFAVVCDDTKEIKT